jgi:undecaprenyl-diphosphatase
VRARRRPDRSSPPRSPYAGQHANVGHRPLIAGPPLIDWVLRHRRGLLVAALGLLAFVFALHAWIELVGPLPGDRAVADWFDQGRPTASLTPDVRNVISVFDDLATPYVAAATVLALTAIAWEAVGPRWALLVVASAAVVVLNATLKHLFGPSPVWVEHGFSGVGLPSGHVAYTTALLGFVAWLSLARGRRAPAAIALCVVALMGPARIVAGTHLPSDVVAGYAVGLAWLAGVLALGVRWAARVAPRAPRADIVGR